MARKSNKTAHVLNLLSSGQQDSAEESEKELEQPQKSKTEAEASTVKAEPEQSKTEAAPAPAPVITQAAAPEVPSNISIIDNGAKEADPIAERIHDELLKELEKEEGASPARNAAPADSSVEEASKAEADASPIQEAPVIETASAPVAEQPKAVTPSSSAAEPLQAEMPSAPFEEAAKAETLSVPVTESPKAEAPSATVTETPKAEATSIPVIETSKAEAPSAPVVEDPKEETAPPSQPEPEEVLELSPEPSAEPEPPAEPEPDYVMLNVMQRVVEDKIIYFMKQFEVCTCDRCRADTIALTLSGLPAKYRIVDKHAVDPLVSYYTSRLISQVTVEALKACTQVKDNPRH